VDLLPLSSPAPGHCKGLVEEERHVPLLVRRGNHVRYQQVGDVVRRDARSVTKIISLVVPPHPRVEIRISPTIFVEVPPTPGPYEGGVHRHRLAFYDASLNKLPCEPVYYPVELLGSDIPAEPGYLGGVVGPLTFLDVADLPEHRVIPESAVQLPVAWYLP